jgi:hypothetical protein
MARSYLLPLFVCLLALAGDTVGAAEPSSALFRPPRRPPVPAVKDRAWVSNPIDAFVLARLEAQGLRPSLPADRLRLLRRVTFDLTGLPPTAEEQQHFLADSSPDAYARVVDRLLASPHHGERWAQHWLDLVRYAETDGFKADDLRPEAHRYRDYVIRALNADLPHDRFIRQQLAGDELEPDNPEALIATGLQRLGPDEYNAANLEQRRQEILDDVTDVAGQVFLGMTFGCARCHDHKYDPITQADYFRLQAFFAPMRQHDLPALPPARLLDYRQRLAAWESASRAVRGEMEALLADKRRDLRQYALGKFRPEIQQAVRTPEERRTPYQQQIALMAEKQLRAAEQGAAAKLPEAQKKRYQELEKKLAAVQPPRPEAPPLALAITDVGPDAPPTHLLQGGDWRKPRDELQPGFPAFLGSATVQKVTPEGNRSTGRRSALAHWLTRKDHPLTARVLINRLWQHHFGVGLVATPSDFGALGEPPTHPELLDWLAVEFVESGWSLKRMHRLMVTSAAYCQDSRIDPDNPVHARALDIDRTNRLLWHARRRRLEGEAIRDAMLALSGELNVRMFGPSARPPLPPGLSKYAWQPDARPADQNRRSVYVFARRNMRYPLFDAFDLPDMHNSCARRLTTTTAPQALLLLNGDFTLDRARRLADSLQTRFARDDAGLVRRACRLAWGRPPDEAELRLALGFLSKQTEAIQAHGPTGGAPESARRAAIADLCHALLNTNEFLYVD